jgi:hypothetical protein
MRQIPVAEPSDRLLNEIDLDYVIAWLAGRDYLQLDQGSLWIEVIVDRGSCAIKDHCRTERRVPGSPI